MLVVEKDSKALPSRHGINLFSELDFQASGDMKDLMSFIGMDSESNSATFWIYKSKYI